jgi:hypothetical protein
VVTIRVAARRERESISAHETTDRAMLRAFLETDRLFAAYALCDLDDREFLRTRWGVATAGGRPVSVVLQYAGISPQPIFVMGENAGIEAILQNVIKPRAAYAAARLESLPAVASHYRVDSGPEMVRMWIDRAHFQPFPADVQRLLPAEIGEVNRLYQLGFASWLPASAIADGLYYGVRVGGRLVSAAGTHVISPSSRLAVVGNVMTHTDHRGRGYHRRDGRGHVRAAAFLRSCRAQRPSRQSTGPGGVPTPRLPGPRQLRRTADSPQRAGLERLDGPDPSPLRGPQGVLIR